MDPVRLFCCYSAKDESLREKLDTHLASLRRQGVISDWHHGHVAPGENSETERARRLEEADIILFLISSDFFAADYLTTKEAQRALLRHQAGVARLIPILIKPTYLAGSPLAELALLPRNGKAITEWRNRDKAWVEVVRGIHVVANELRKNHYQGVAWEIRLGAELGEVRRLRVIQLLAQLKELSNDSDLTIRAVAEGSTRLIIKGSWSGFVRIAMIVAEGKLSELGGLPIQRVRLLRSLMWISLGVWLYSIAKFFGFPERGYFPALQSWVVAAITALGLAGTSLTAVVTSKILRGRIAGTRNLNGGEDLMRLSVLPGARDMSHAADLLMPEPVGRPELERLPQPADLAVSLVPDVPDMAQKSVSHIKDKAPGLPGKQLQGAKCPDERGIDLNRATIVRRLDDLEKRLSSCWADANKPANFAVLFSVDCDGSVGVELDEKSDAKSMGDCIMDAVSGITFRRPKFEQKFLYHPPSKAR